MLGALLLQVNKCTAHLLGATLSKLVQHYVAHTVFQSVVRQLGQLDVAAGYLKVHQFACRWAHCLQHKCGAWLATQMTAHVAHILRCHHRVVDAQYHVALLQSSLSGRHILVGLVDNHTIQLLVLAHDSTYTRVLTCQHLSQVLGILLRIVFGIGVQTAQHGVDGCAHGCLWVQRVNV